MRPLPELRTGKARLVPCPLPVVVRRRRAA